jgi:hypothetical protein
MMVRSPGVFAVGDLREPREAWLFFFVSFSLSDAVADASGRRCRPTALVVMPHDATRLDARACACSPKIGLILNTAPRGVWRRYPQGMISMAIPPTRPQCLTDVTSHPMLVSVADSHQTDPPVTHRARTPIDL